MKNYFLYAVASALLHLFLFVKIDLPKEVATIEKRIVSKIVLEKKEVRKKKIIKSKKMGLNKLGLTKVNPDDYKMTGYSELGESQRITLFGLIDEYLTYPKELVENQVQGEVSAEVFISQSGEYLEDKTVIKCYSPYLKVHMARIFRKALTKNNVKKLGLKRMTNIKLMARFYLTTSKRLVSESGILPEFFYFYRQAYGVSNPKDRLVKGIHKTLIHVTNWLSLLEYLPDSNKEKSRKIWQLSTYERDPFWSR